MTDKKFNLTEKIFWIDDLKRRGGRIKDREKLIEFSKSKNQNPSKYLRGSYKIKVG